MKKKVCAVCCLVAAFTAAAAFAGCKDNNSLVSTQNSDNELIEEIGGCSETYEGGVSETAYSEEKVAAKAYVQTELLGSDTQAQITVKEPQTVTKEDAAKVIPDAFTKDATEFKKVEVTYTQAASGTTAQAFFLATGTGAAQTKTVVVYLIKYGNEGWKYFTPKVEVGNAVTKSYYDSIFNAAKYKNCTMESVVTLAFHVDMPLEIEDNKKINFLYSGSVTISQTAKYTQTGVYYTVKSDSKQDVSCDDEALMQKKWTEEYPDSDGTWKDGIFTFFGNPLQSFIQNYEIYVEMLENDTANVYVKAGADQQWTKASSVISVNNAQIKNLYPFADQYAINYTFFTKTDTGCAVEKDSLVDYFKQTLYGNLAGSQDGVKFNDGSVKFYVSEGVLSAMSANISMEISYGEAGKSKIDVSNTSKVTGYGTTVVTRPEGITAPSSEEE